MVATAAMAATATAAATATVAATAATAIRIEKLSRSRWYDFEHDFSLTAVTVRTRPKGRSERSRTLFLGY